MNNIFEGAKFGDHYRYEGMDCIFLEIAQFERSYKYRLAVNYKDTKREYVTNILARKDGCVYKAGEPDSYVKQLSHKAIEE